ncbi:MAG: GntR family transcriptional regulator [Pisciglobus halotolerans]|nr:GntR family transcriptional regulator [Pisciglobus halotolerans]
MTKPKSLEWMAYDYIMEQIKSRQWLPQTHVTEQKLSLELNMSRTPIRQALLRLQKEGHLVIEPHKGAKIQKPPVDGDEFQDRSEVAEMILIHYLHQLQIHEIQFDTARLQAIQKKMEEQVNADKSEPFFEEEVLYWGELLKYAKNTYMKSLLLYTIRSMNHQEDQEIIKVMDQARLLKVKHVKHLTNLVSEGEYAKARKEIRILGNQLNLAVIQGF